MMRIRWVLLFSILILFLFTLSIPMQPRSAAYADETEVEYWAVLVGVANYQYIEDLDYSDDDARELHEKLAPIWGEDHIKLLVNHEATKANIEDAIYSWLAPHEDADDVVLFFFSGHGGEYLGDYYICPYDALLYSYANDIRDNELASWLGTLESDNRIVVLDTCHSGGFIPELSASNLVIVTSSDADESSWGVTTLGHGIASYYLLEAISNAEPVDTNGNHEISAEEIAYYIESEVIAFTTVAPPIEHPQIYDGYTGELALFMMAIFDTSPGTTSLTIDGTTYSPGQIPVSLLWMPGSVHECEASSIAPGATGIRYIFTSWSDGNPSPSRTVSRGGAYTANYKTQYYLIVTSDHGDPAGEGWYDEGTTAQTGTAQALFSAGNTRYIFLNWIVDGTDQTGNPISVIMNSPHTASTDYKTQHYLTVESEYGDPAGEEWYDGGSTATASVTSPLGTLIRQVFTGWSGDSTAATPSANILMSSPKTVTANWRTDYLYLYILIGGLVGLVGVVSISVILIRSRRKAPRRIKPRSIII